MHHLYTFQETDTFICCCIKHERNGFIYSYVNSYFSQKCEYTFLSNVSLIITR
jgi:hypothetical protein